MKLVLKVTLVNLGTLERKVIMELLVLWVPRELPDPKARLAQLARLDLKDSRAKLVPLAIRVKLEKPVLEATQVYTAMSVKQDLKALSVILVLRVTRVTMVRLVKKVPRAKTGTQVLKAFRVRKVNLERPDLKVSVVPPEHVVTLDLQVHLVTLATQARTVVLVTLVVKVLKALQVFQAKLGEMDVLDPLVTRDSQVMLALQAMTEHMVHKVPKAQLVFQVLKVHEAM